MKVKARFPFYHSELGLVKRGEVLDVTIDLGDLVEVIDEPVKSKPAPKSKTGTKSRNKRV